MRKYLMFVVAVSALVACTEDPADNGGTVNLSPDSLVLSVGQTQSVSASGSQAVTYTSRNIAIATVTAAGAVTGKGAGTTYVVAEAGSARDSSKIVVAYAMPVVLQRLGFGTVPERYTAEIAEAGGWAYTTTWGSRLVNGTQNRGNAIKIWNVSGNTPVLTDSIIIAAAGTTSDVQISSDGTLLVVSVESGGAAANGIYIYNRANPAKPTLTAEFHSPNTARGVHTVKLSRINNRHYAFLQIDPSPALLVIADITTPTAATEVYAQAMGQPYIHDVFVRDGILFAALWNTGLTIFDVGGGNHGGSPANPVQLGNVKTLPCLSCSATAGSSAHNVWWFQDPLSGSKKYAFVGEEVPGSFFGDSRGDIHVIDVSDFSNPHEVAVYSPDPATTSSTGNAGAHNFDVDEPSGMLYSAFYNGGVRVLDVRGDLSNCTTVQKTPDGRCNLRLMGREAGIAQVTAPTYVWGVKLDGNVLYVSDMPNGIHKYDITPLKR